MAGKKTTKSFENSSGALSGTVTIPIDKIAMRAYEKWCNRGCPHGSDNKDWHEAEAELRAQLQQGATVGAGKKGVAKESTLLRVWKRLFGVAKRLVTNEGVFEGCGAPTSSASKQKAGDVLIKKLMNPEAVVGKVDVLIRKLSDPDDSVAEEAAARLTFFGEEATLPLIGVLDADSPKVRARGRECFFTIYRDLPLSSKLREALESDHRKIRLAAIEEIVTVLPVIWKEIAQQGSRWKVLEPLIHGNEPHVGKELGSVTEDPVLQKTQNNPGKVATQSQIGAQTKDEHVETAVGGVRWKPYLDMYPQLRALKFADQEQYAAAAKLLWNELRDLPFDIVGNHTIIIPADATSCFGGLQFVDTDVLSPADLPPEELAELRRERGPN